MSKSSFAWLLALVLLGLPIAASALTTDERQSRIGWCPALQRPLWLGYRGSDVSDLQTFLYDEGVFDRAATGFFGPLTERALQEWQARHDIASTGDANTTGWGRLGPQTRARIAELCRPAGGTSFFCPAIASTTPTESCTGAWERLNGLRGCHVGWRCVPMSYAQNHPPIISSFEGPTALTIGESGTWIVQASDPENSTLSYRVMWGDEGVQEQLLYLAEFDTDAFSQSTTFTHAFVRAGTYVVHLTVRDSGGNTALGIMMVTVNQPPAHDVLPEQAPREQLDQLLDSAAVRKLVCPLFKRLEHPLSEGMNGDDVRGLQEFLRAEGFLFTVSTGFFGPRTREALQGWQAAQHIVSNGNAQTTGWGIVGPATRERIKRWCSDTQEVPTTPPVACTADAKQCPDGSYVGRTGPNCEFQCPNSTAVGCVYKGVNFPDGTSFSGGPNSAQCKVFGGAYCQVVVTGTITPLPYIQCKTGKWMQYVYQYPQGMIDKGEVDPETLTITTSTGASCTYNNQTYAERVTHPFPCGASRIAVCLWSQICQNGQWVSTTQDSSGGGAVSCYMGQCTDGPYVQTSYPDANCKTWGRMCYSCTRSTPGGVGSCTISRCLTDIAPLRCSAYFPTTTGASCVDFDNGKTYAHGEQALSWTSKRCCNGQWLATGNLTSPPQCTQ